MKRILIATGGSGGHVLPALSMFDHLKENYEIKLVTDKRGSNFINKNKYTFYLIDVPNLFSKLYLFPINLVNFILSIFKSYFFLKKQNINFLISTGGYMSIPFCIASRLLNIKIFLFEPNSVLGRSNKFILSISEKIICYDENIKLFPKKFLNKIYLISPILRKEIYYFKKIQIKKEIIDIKKILVIGGSQGAKFFDKNITELILEISKTLNIKVTQQVYDKKEKYIIEQKYRSAGIKFDLFDFKGDFFKNLNDYDLAITRSGASAIAELAFFNIPFIAIPFPFAKDDHQYFNAKFYENRGSCWLVEQDHFNIIRLNKFLIQLFEEKVEYLKKKQNLANITNQNTWNNVNKKILELFDES